MLNPFYSNRSNRIKIIFILIHEVDNMLKENYYLVNFYVARKIICLNSTIH